MPFAINLTGHVMMTSALVLSARRQGAQVGDEMPRLFLIGSDIQLKLRIFWFVQV